VTGRTHRLLFVDPLARGRVAGDLFVDDAWLQAAKVGNDVPGFFVGKTEGGHLRVADAMADGAIDRCVLTAMFEAA